MGGHVDSRGSLNLDISAKKVANSFSSQEVQIDSEAIATADLQMKKISQARKTEAKLRQVHGECARLIESDNSTGLKAYMSRNHDLLVCDVIDSNGKTLLHECTFNDSFKCL